MRILSFAFALALIGAASVDLDELLRIAVYTEVTDSDISEFADKLSTNNIDASVIKAIRTLMLLQTIQKLQTPRDDAKFKKLENYLNISVFRFTKGEPGNLDDAISQISDPKSTLKTSIEQLETLLRTTQDCTKVYQTALETVNEIAEEKNNKHRAELQASLAQVHDMTGQSRLSSTNPDNSFQTLVDRLKVTIPTVDTLQNEPHGGSDSKVATGTPAPLTMAHGNTNVPTNVADNVEVSTANAHNNWMKVKTNLHTIRDEKRIRKLITETKLPLINYRQSPLNLPHSQSMPLQRSRCHKSLSRIIQLI
jgi:hypothetical protein